MSVGDISPSGDNVKQKYILGLVEVDLEFNKIEHT
jgi:hypothetical protein